MSAQRRQAARRDATAAAPPGAAPSPRPVAPSPRPASPRPAAPSPRPVAPSPRPAAPSARPAAPGPGGDRGKVAPVTGRVDARLGGVRRVYQDSMAEIRKVNWPDRETTKNLTLVVIGVAAVLGVLLGGIDFVLRLLFEALP